jgi:UDPglucose 6-dehydrogenase
MKIAVVGTGYVGLVVGTCFAEYGNDVVCVDIDEQKIAALQQGRIPIYEPGLEELVKRNSAEGRLRFTTDVTEAVRTSLFIFIAVGTPEGEDGAADLRHVLAVARSIGSALNGYKVIVEKSTVPVGTAAKVKAAIAPLTPHPFDVVSNPEFLKEGAAIDDFMKPDRIVIGCEDPRVEELMKELYAPFVRTGKPIVTMDPASAELTKYAANAMLATRISFMNEIANLCERVGANVNKVREGMGLDSRIGMPFLFPGCGYGGSCFPKDVKALVKTALEYGSAMTIVQAVEAVNAQQKRRLVEKILKHFRGAIQGKTFAVWGLAFKPNTDDMREAPAVTVIEALLQQGALVRGSDPEALEEAKKLFGERIVYCPKPLEALRGADGLVVVTEWNEFRRPDFETMKSLLKQPLIFDGRNIYNPKWMKDLGFTYYGIGLPDPR